MDNGVYKSALALILLRQAGFSFHQGSNGEKVLNRVNEIRAPNLKVVEVTDCDVCRFTGSGGIMGVRVLKRIVVVPILDMDISCIVIFIHPL